MADVEVFFFIVFSFLVLSLQPTTNAKICRDWCGELGIRFPFRLSSQPERCGYPHFTLTCNQTQTTITMPFEAAGDEFIVENIDYWSQSLWLGDPDNCAPRRLLKGLNLSNTSFELLNPQNYMFFNCSINATLPTQVSYISCLSDTTFSVVAIPMPTNIPGNIKYESCSEIATVAVPANSDPNFDVIRLTWNEPNCKSCEDKAGTCMFKSDTGLDVGCSGGVSSGLAKSAEYGIAFGLGIPLLSVMGVVFYLQRKVNNYHDQQGGHPSGEIAIPVTTRRLAADPKGLDGQTIEAYPTTLVGESGELPKPNDNTCSICLCEYQAKETLRTIPDCNHYFHASCIDEWLRLNASCPVCRHTGERSALIAASSSSSSLQ